MYVAFIISRGEYLDYFTGGNMWNTLAAAKRQMRQTNEQTNKQTDRQTDVHCHCVKPLAAEA